jgi:hypothetical protein
MKAIEVIKNAPDQRTLFTNGQHMAEQTSASARN